MAAEVRDLLATTIYHYDHGSFEIFAFRTYRESDMTLRVRDCVAWVVPAELEGYPLAPADVVLVQHLLSKGSWI